MFHRNNTLQNHDDDSLNVSDANEPITIQIRLNGTSAQNFRIARGALSAAAVVTIVSALWGAGTAWWLAWNEISGASADRDMAQAKLVAGEVTKAIAANGVLARSERDLLTQIRDSFDRVIVSARGIGSAVVGAEKSDHALIAEKNRERSAYERAAEKGSPDLNLSVRGIDVGSQMKVESLAYFRSSGSDVIRIDLGHGHERMISGEIMVVAKYRSGDSEKIVGCCGDITDAGGGHVTAASGVQFRAKLRVRKHIEVQRPADDGAELLAVKIGVLTNLESGVRYSDWIQAHHRKPESLALNIDHELPRQLPKKTQPKIRGKIPKQEIEKRFSDDIVTEQAADVRHFPGDERDVYDEMAGESATFSDHGNDSALSHAMNILSRLGSGSDDEDILTAE